MGGFSALNERFGLKVVLVPAAHVISTRESGTVNGLGLVLVSYSLVSERDGDKGEENEDDDGDWCCAGRTFLSSTVTYVIQVYHSMRWFTARRRAVNRCAIRSKERGLIAHETGGDTRRTARLDGTRALERSRSAYLRRLP